MTIYIGGEEIGGGEASSTTFLTSIRNSFVRGLQNISGSTLAHLIGTFNVWEEVMGAFISGINTSGNNTLSSWGPVQDIDAGIIHVYNPKTAYINGLLGTLSSSKSAYIPSYVIILRAPTLDGQLDSLSTFVDDISEVNNDGITFNSPTWIQGPH